MISRSGDTFWDIHHPVFFSEKYHLFLLPLLTIFYCCWLRYPPSWVTSRVGVLRTPNPQQCSAILARASVAEQKKKSINFHHRVFFFRFIISNPSNHIKFIHSNHPFNQSFVSFLLSIIAYQLIICWASKLKSTVLMLFELSTWYTAKSWRCRV